MDTRPEIVPVLFFVFLKILVFLRTVFLIVVSSDLQENGTGRFNFASLFYVGSESKIFTDPYPG
jgi:hypothetical protein